MTYAWPHRFSCSCRYLITNPQLAFWGIVGLSLVVITPWAWAEQGEPLAKLPKLPSIEDSPVEASDRALTWGRRGKIGVYLLPPGKIETEYDSAVIYPPRHDDNGAASNRHSKRKDPGQDYKSMRVTYTWDQDHRSFHGAYFLLMADISAYKTLTFMIKGDAGGEAFEIGINDLVANEREEAIMIGSIYRYLPQGVTTEWQQVSIPLDDFYGADLSQTYCVLFAINEPGQSTFWVDDVRLHREQLVDRQAQIRKQGFLLLDDFDHSPLNCLGRHAKSYHGLPSQCTTSRVYIGSKRDNRALKLEYDKQTTGWCGYYTLLNEIDGQYYDLSAYQSVSFDVRGDRGGEVFEVGLADRQWQTIGDSRRAGRIDQFLETGVTTRWQTVTIPLSAFGQLDLREMGSFIISFPETSVGSIFIDNLRFNLGGYNGR